MNLFIQIIKYSLESIFFIIFLLIFKIFSLELARKIGIFISVFLGKYTNANKVIKKNLIIAFPNETDEWHVKTIKEIWINFGKIIAEYAHIKKLSNKNNNKIYIPDNKHSRDFFNEENKNILVSAHSSNWEIPGIACRTKSNNISGIVREPNNPFIKLVLSRMRRENSVKCYEKNMIGTKKLIKDFNNGRSVALLADQELSSGIETTFFGRIVHSTSLPAQLALKSKCNIYLGWPRRINGAFEFEIFPPIETKDLENNEKNIRLIIERINLFFEEQIKKNPSEYFWHHNRWKN